MSPGGDGDGERQDVMMRRRSALCGSIYATRSRHAHTPFAPKSRAPRGVHVIIRLPQQSHSMAQSCPPRRRRRHLSSSKHFIATSKSSSPLCTSLFGSFYPVLSLPVNQLYAHTVKPQLTLTMEGDELYRLELLSLVSKISELLALIER